jgi:hypothetical protein
MIKQAQLVAVALSKELLFYGLGMEKCGPGYQDSVILRSTAQLGDNSL